MNKPHPSGFCALWHVNMADGGTCGTYLQQVEEHLQCPVCLDQYREPKQLRCHHSFCKECLEGMPLEGGRGGPQTLRCPTCREATPLTNGVSALPSSFLLVNLLEICKRTQRISVTATDQEEPSLCPEHNKALDIFCNKCEVVICHHCSLRGHRDHGYDLIADAWTRQFGEVCEKLIPLQMQAHYLGEACTALHEFDDKLVESEKAVKHQINQAADSLIAAVEESRHELIQKTTEATQRKRSVVSLQKEKAIDVLAQLLNCKSSVEHLLGHGSQFSVLARKAEVVQQLSFYDSLDLQAFEPSEVNDIVFHPFSDEEPFQGLGSLTSTHLGDTCSITGEGISVAYLNKSASFEVVLARKEEDSPMNPILESLVSCEAMAEDGEIKCAVSQSCSNTFSVRYTPKVRGSLHLIVKVGGEEVAGSPFDVQVLPSLELLHVIGNLKKPQGLAANELGQLAVVEKGRDCVTLFNKKGIAFSKCKVFDPTDVTFSPDHHVLVTSAAGKVYKYSTDGKLIAEVGNGLKFTNIPEPLAFHIPSGLAMSTNGKVYIAECSSHSLQVINLDFAYCQHITGFGGNDVALDSMGNILVADCIKGCINKLSPSGVLQASFGSLIPPFSIALDKSDVVYVAERKKHCVTVFDPNGHCLTRFGSKGSGPEQFNSPSGIFIDQQGTVYVSDSGNNRVLIFK